MSLRAAEALMAQLADAAPNRFVWFPTHKCLRVSLAAEGHGTGNPCTDAFPFDNAAHEGLVIWGIWQECHRLGWEWSLTTMTQGYRQERDPEALVYVDTDDSNTKPFTDKASPMLALTRAFLYAARREYGGKAVAP